MREAMFFGNQILPEPNTFIGGVGATTITGALDYVAKTTGLLESDIQNFQIDISNNVSFFINKNYSQNTLAFFDDDDFTYFIDVDAHVTSLQINVCDNIEYIYAPNAIGGLVGRNISLLKLNINFTSLSARFQLENQPIKLLYLQNASSAVNSISNRAACGLLTQLERLYLPNLNIVSAQFTNGSQLASSDFFIELINTNCKIYYNTVFGIQDRNAYAKLQGFYSVGDIININGLSYTAVAGSPTTEGEFQADVTGQTGISNFILAINNDSRPGTYSNITAQRLGSSVALVVDDIGIAGNSVTLSLDPGNPGIATISHLFKGGNDLHPWLIYARDERSATLVELGTPIIVNTPTNLSASNQTATSVDLSFTTPVVNANGSDGYEVWVDDGTVFRKWFEFTEITSSGDTLDLTDVFNDVGTISGTKIKIRTIDGHFNLSDFSNEIILP